MLTVIIEESRDFFLAKFHSSAPVICFKINSKLLYYTNLLLLYFSPYDLNFRNPPPPLPPKKNSVCLTPTGLTNTAPSNVFQPSLLVRTPSDSSSGINNNNRSNNGPSHLVVTPLNRRTQQRYRVEAKRNSILSSDEEDDDQHFSTTHRHSLVRFILSFFDMVFGGIYIYIFLFGKMTNNIF